MKPVFRSQTWNLCPKPALSRFHQIHQKPSNRDLHFYRPLRTRHRDRRGFLFFNLALKRRQMKTNLPAAWPGLDRSILPSLCL
jgi:hypothetical protein